MESPKSIELSITSRTSSTSTMGSNPTYRAMLPDELASLLQLALEIQTPQNIDMAAFSIVNSPLLIVDIRPESQHVRQAILGSTNLSVPSTLLKRPSFGIDKIIGALKTEADRKAFEDLSSKTHIVVYDAGTERIMPDGPMALLMQKFERLGIKASLAWLQGGVLGFGQQYPSFIVGTREAPQENGGDGFACLSLMTPGGTKAHFTLPHHPEVASPVIHGNLFPKNGKSAYATHVETSMAELEHLTIFRGNKPPSTAPKFLKSLCDEPDVKSCLHAKFKQIEHAEQKRFQACMRAKTPQDDFSISVGIEMGYKNRYSNVWPYNYNRVKLTAADCDYINASHIKVPPYDYICTQGPMTETFYDFWTMVRETNSQIVVMLTKEEDHGRKQCHRYWPTAESSWKLRDLELKFVREQPLTSAVVVRLFDAHFGDEPVKRIYQVQYLTWPDHGVPEDVDDVIGLWEVVDCVREKIGAQAPTIVHCSAGCGRTGTFCTVDYLFTRYYPRHINPQADSGEDDVLDIVQSLRQQRLLMVQTFSQFAFCYEALLKRSQKPSGVLSPSILQSVFE